MSGLDIFAIIVLLILIVAAITIWVVLAMLPLAWPTVASDKPVEPTEPPLGPPAVFEDAAGDVGAGGGPDFISCAVSEPWESLIRFELEFTTDPPLSYDLETMTTDELWVAVATGSDPVFPDDLVYALIVHGATLPQALDSGPGLYDATASEGDEVFWGVVDVALDGPKLTLTVDRKLLGDPDELAFVAWAGSEGEDGSGGHDSCPDEEAGPGEYQLVGT